MLLRIKRKVGGLGDARREHNRRQTVEVPALPGTIHNPEYRRVATGRPIPHAALRRVRACSRCADASQTSKGVSDGRAAGGRRAIRAVMKRRGPPPMDTQPTEDRRERRAVPIAPLQTKRQSDQPGLEPSRPACEGRTLPKGVTQESARTARSSLSITRPASLMASRVCRLPARCTSPDQ